MATIPGIVTDPLNNWEEKWVTTVENPEKPGQILWVKYMEGMSEGDLDVPPLILWSISTSLSKIHHIGTEGHPSAALSVATLTIQKKGKGDLPWQIRICQESQQEGEVKTRHRFG
ncbi:uncharacterized protein LOC121052503 [Rosa chinensis]|uniref:uncharacterized protein LOC121052503 n=1 Tax=Rosa chinensis TaxID=74649 RepID=UPI001AD8E22F|nr:uncharacterized protein LOC121052503 [Rosa chinensis]